MTQVLNENQFKELYPKAHAVLFKRTTEMYKSDRLPTETLHDYLLRKNIPCFCRFCMAQRKEEQLSKTTPLF